MLKSFLSALAAFLGASAGAAVWEWLRQRHRRRHTGEVRTRN